MADTTAKPAKSQGSATKPRARKPRSAKTAATVAPAEAARSRFAAALEEAKSGAAVLTDDARARAAALAEETRKRSEELAEQARLKAVELAEQGKSKAVDALEGLGRKVEENATVIDEKLGPEYGDYARGASRTLQQTAARLEGKSVEDLAADAREYVRRNPGKSLGIAVVAGYLLSRLFRR